MYPVIRLAIELALWRRRPLAIDGTHVSSHRCMPWDLDVLGELNNGRTLTIYDLGRIPLIVRQGMPATLRAHGWAVTVAGASVRFRRRVRMFDRVRIASCHAGRDDRFFYVTQSMWRGDDCVNAALFRLAVTGRSGLVPPQRFLDAHGAPDWDPPLPDWVTAWSAAEAHRPWPPTERPGDG